MECFYPLKYSSFLNSLHSQNPVALQGFASGITNLDGLTKGFGEEVSVATAWSHFLAEDLFIVSLRHETA